MKRRKRSTSRASKPATTSGTDERARERGDEALQGPPARETVQLRGDAARQAEEALDQHTSTSPALAGGDVDADWRRADSVGEEAPGGTVATPDQDSVDAAGDALGVPRAPDEEFRPSTEILEGRDRYRREEEEE
jgi:hypothetical protein